MRQITPSRPSHTSFQDMLREGWPTDTGMARGTARRSTPGLPPLEQDPLFADWAERSCSGQAPVKADLPDRPAGRPLLRTWSLVAGVLALPAVMFARTSLREPGAVANVLPVAARSAPDSAPLSRPDAHESGAAPATRASAVANSRPAEHAAAAIRSEVRPPVHRAAAVGSKRAKPAIASPAATPTRAPESVREAGPDPALQQAQIAFAQGDHERAVAMALRATTASGPEVNTAWRFLATAACRTGDAQLAIRAYAHVSDGDRQFVAGVCRRDGVELTNK